MNPPVKGKKKKKKRNGGCHLKYMLLDVSSNKYASDMTVII